MLKKATLGIWGKSCADPDYFGLVGGISSAGEGSFFSIFLLYEFNKIVNFLLLVLREGHCITSPTKS